MAGAELAEFEKLGAERASGRALTMAIVGVKEGRDQEALVAGDQAVIPWLKLRLASTS
jgi:hypothetical protein